MSVELFLNQAVVVLAAAVLVLLVSHRLRLPPVIGLLLTGMVAGPSGLSLVGDADQVRVFAEIGVMFLLFSIGLEFSVTRLREVGRPFLLGGSLQSGLTIGAAALGAALAGTGAARAVFFGFLVALSSTAIVLKIYTGQRATETPHARVGIAVLLFQDFLIVPMVVLTPVLAGGSMSLTAVALRLAGSLIVMGLLFLVARRVMPRVLDIVAATRLRELFVLGAVGACLGMAVLTAELGFSFALGAFVAGVIIAESDYSHQVLADIGPFRDVFSSIFFISIGMLLDLRLALDNASQLAALALAIIALKAGVTVAAVLVTGYPLRTALLVGLALAQIGEFSFVLLQVGRDNALIDAAAYQLLIGTAILSMLATPLLVTAGPRIAEWASRMAPGRPPAEPPAAPAAPLRNHVVVVGFGLAGRTLAKVLRSAGVPYVVIELNGETVRRARATGERILYGDATRREVLDAAAIARAGAVVFVVSDIDAVRRSIRLVRALNPAAHIVVRTRQFAQIEELIAGGADEVIAEEFETSIEILTRVLRHFHVPRNLILAETRLLRGEEYRMLRTPGADSELTQTLLQVLQMGTTDIFLVGPDSPHGGRTLRDLDLRARTGASVIALVRGENPETNPGPDVALEPGDCLVLVGSHAQIENAFSFLEAGDEDVTPGAETADGR